MTFVDHHPVYRLFQFFHILLVVVTQPLMSPLYSSSSNMNSVVHTRGLDPVSFLFHKRVLFLQVFTVQSHANFPVHLSLSLYCSNFDQKIFRSHCFKPIPSLESILNTFASRQVWYMKFCSHLAFLGRLT